MKKQILNKIGIAAIAALLCVTCGDNGLERSPNNDGDVARFLDRVNYTDPCAGGVSVACCNAQPGYPGCTSDPTPSTYTLTVSANPYNGGSVSRNPNYDRYNHGTSVTVTASAYSNYTFTGWSGASSSTGASVTVMMDGNKTLTANFQQQAVTPTTYIVTFNANGGSGTAPAAQTVNAGYSTTLPNKGTLTRTGYDFDGWNTYSDGTGNNYSAGSTYTPTSNITLYAKWTSSRIIDNSLVSGANEAWIAYYIDELGTTEQNFGFVFKANGQVERIEKNNAWTCSGAGTWYVEEDEDFDTYKRVYIITDNDSYRYYYYQFRTGLGKRLSAAATGSIVFIKKTGLWPSCTNTGNPTNPCASGPTAACCAYNSSYPGCTSTPTTYTLTTYASPSGSGSIDRYPTGSSYTSGTQVTLTATPAACQAFSYWSGDASGTSSSTTITMNANKSVTAVFTNSPGSNLLRYPNFSSIGYSEGEIVDDIWRVHAWSNTGYAPTATYSVSAGVLIVAISGSTGYAENVQVVQEAVMLVRSQRYRLTFTARASASRTIDAIIQKNGWNDDVWTDYLSESVSLTTSNNTFTYDFIQSQSVTTARLAFNIGSVNGTVYISNVSLVEVLCE